MDVYDKLRLLACYLATHPAKLDVTKRMQWQKVRQGERVQLQVPTHNATTSNCLQAICVQARLASRVRG